MFKVNSKDTRAASFRSSGIFSINFEHTSHLALIFILLTLNLI